MDPNQRRNHENNNLDPAEAAPAPTAPVSTTVPTVVGSMRASSSHQPRDPPVDVVLSGIDDSLKGFPGWIVPDVRDSFGLHLPHPQRPVWGIPCLFTHIHYSKYHELRRIVTSLQEHAYAQSQAILDRDGVVEAQRAQLETERQERLRLHALMDARQQEEERHAAELPVRRDEDTPVVATFTQDDMELRLREIESSLALEMNPNAAQQCSSQPPSIKIEGIGESIGGTPSSGFFQISDSETTHREGKAPMVPSPVDGS